MQKRHKTYTSSPYKNFFLNQIVNIFTFTSSIISVIRITLVIYLFCKHKHNRTIVVSLILHKAKEVEAKLTTETNNSECNTLAYIAIALTILSMNVKNVRILRRMTNKEIQNFHIMIKQGKTWYNLETEIETV